MINHSVKEAPAFLRQSVIYQINLRTFTPEGTLKAAEKRLPHVASIGVDIVYLCPVVLADDDPRPEFWSERQRKSGCNNPKNSYRISDFYAIDPEYGTDADLKDFVAAAHRLGLRVLLDLVYFHCGPSAVFLKEHPDFVMRAQDGSAENGFWCFPKLNYDSPGLREYLWRNMEYFIREFDVDGYRCDVAGLVPLDFWEEGRRRIDALKPDLVMLAESEGDRRDEQRFAFELNYGFSFFQNVPRVLLGDKPVCTLREAHEKLRALALPGARFIHGTDNHDLANDQYENRVEKVCPEWCPASLVLCFALDGVPMLYNGQEIADAHRHNFFANRFHGPVQGIDWTQQNSPAAETRMRLVRGLITLRRSTPALTLGATRWVDTPWPEELLAFRRETPEQTVFAVVNLGHAARTLALPSGRLLLSGGMAACSGGAVTLPPGGYLLLEQNG